MPAFLSMNAMSFAWSRDASYSTTTRWYVSSNDTARITIHIAYAVERAEFPFAHWSLVRERYLKNVVGPSNALSRHHHLLVALQVLEMCFTFSTVSMCSCIPCELLGEVELALAFVPVIWTSCPLCSFN
jgi:hypothetical protein